MAGPVVLDLLSVELEQAERELLLEPMVGGLILFARNYESKAQLRQLIHNVRTIRPELLIMVDQEGGRVQRFKGEFATLPPLQAIGRSYNTDPSKGLRLAYDHAWLMATELISVGVDLSLAPVLDMDHCFSDVVGDRSFGSNPDHVTALSRAYIEGMNDAGMCAVAKHFPGHGSVQLDSHKALPVDNRSLNQVESSDMLPFTALCHHYAAIMPAHIRYPTIDANPVGYSQFWLQEVLRKRLGFTGVIFSDDLSMEGAAVAGTYCQRADAALAGGCDAVLVCNHPDKAAEVVMHLKRQNCAMKGRLQSLKTDQFAQAQRAALSKKWRSKLNALEQLNF